MNCISKIGIIGILFLMFVASCGVSKKDTYYSLLDAQKQFINTVQPGDTVIWQSSSGLKDTAIISPVTTQNYLINTQHDGDVYGQIAYYTYNFVGTKKTNVGYGVEVRADNYTPSFNGTWCSLGNNFTVLSGALGVFTQKQIGSTLYQNVYWSTGLVGVVDSVFWNNQGCLGTTYNGQSVFKIK